MTFSFIRALLFTSNISSKLQFFFRYYSLILFVVFIYASSIAVRNYVNNSLSISLVEPEIIASQESLAPEESSVKLNIAKGDTLGGVLTAQNLSKEDIAQILAIPEVQKISSSLKIGQKITFDYDYKITEYGEDELASEVRSLSKIRIEIDKINHLEIVRSDIKFEAKNTAVKLNKFVKRSNATINSNFIASLKSLGLSTNTIIELVNAYSYQVDFQRQIKPGDTITVLAEKFVDEDGNFSHHGKVLYASLNASGKEYNIYRYSADDNPGNYKFFSEDGKSAQRSLLRTPLKLIRVTSSYGNRKHPISGYTKKHQGVDFAAPIGTPIYAAGDGVITEMCHKGGYGKFVQIKHTPTLSTAYAHASKFASGLRVGSKIKQGQVVAYVGVSGRTTGAHLHYEVKIEGKHVNPMSIKTTPNIVIAKNQLAKFQNFKNKLQKLNQELVDTVEVAAN
jgi:murein DD-endopeptidase MepM/ murein hydrolase activator NlpD